MSIRATGTSILLLLVLTAAALAAPTTPAAGNEDAGDNGSQANAAAVAIASFEDQAAVLGGPRVAEPTWRDDFYDEVDGAGAGPVSMAAEGENDDGGGEDGKGPGTAALVGVMTIMLLIGLVAVMARKRGRRAGAAGSAGSLSSGTSISSLSSASTAESSVQAARVMAGLSEGGRHPNATPAGSPHPALALAPASEAPTSEIEYGQLHLDADDGEHAGGATGVVATDV